MYHESELKVVCLQPMEREPECMLGKHVVPVLVFYVGKRYGTSILSAYLHISHFTFDIHILWKRTLAVCYRLLSAYLL